MTEKSVTVGAIIGTTLIALLLTGSTRNTGSTPSLHSPRDSPELARLKNVSTKLAMESRYLEARDSFRATARQAEREGNARASAMNWTNAGVCSMLVMQFRAALEDMTTARKKAERSGEIYSLGAALNNIADLYIHIGQPERAMLIASDALAGPAGSEKAIHPKLLCQIAYALAALGRTDEAISKFLLSINEFLDQSNVEDAVRALGALGAECLTGDRLDLGEWALDEGFRLGRMHGLVASGDILRGLAKARSRRGDNDSAAILFEEAIAAPAKFTPRYSVVADRGEFRLRTGDFSGALADFRAARRVASEMRADMVPADQDRIALESGLSPMLEGIVDAGNRLARETGNRNLLEETFEAAEQDRLWSLRALVPTSNDWRSKLTPRYWEVLARYQAMMRAPPVASPDADLKSARLRQELQQMEASAADTPAESRAESPLAHIRRILDEDTVVLSFHLTKTSSWVWAIDRQHVEAFPLCPVRQITANVSGLRRALSEEKSIQAKEFGRTLYRDLFGPVPEVFLAHKHWRLELEGPLYELPFAALVTGENALGPIYLIERADLESIPGALLAEHGVIPPTGDFVGVGDPIYSPADERYRGKGGASGQALPRLPNTLPELQACVRAWNSAGSRILTGLDAQIDSVRTALRTKPAILHFATHVVPQQDDFQSGVIALSLDSSGGPGLLGPREIVARGHAAKLVVMNGCHSAQGKALPGAGLMGLTRAWIGAGAMTVMATQWDIPDIESQLMMTEFYRALKTAPEQGAASALQIAQRAALRIPPAREFPGRWAGYFLLSRAL